jgi:hypothetical protein
LPEARAGHAPRRTTLGSPPERFPWVTIIGIVGDARHVGFDTAPRPEVYQPYACNPLGAPILVIRTAADPAPLAGLLGARAWPVNAGVPAYNVYLMNALVERSAAQRRFVMFLLTGFADCAWLWGRRRGALCGWSSDRACVWRQPESSVVRWRPWV